MVSLEYEVVFSQGIKRNAFRVESYACCYKNGGFPWIKKSVLAKGLRVIKAVCLEATHDIVEPVWELRFLALQA